MEVDALASQEDDSSMFSSSPMEVDSVRWQGSQTACPALDILINEALELPHKPSSLRSSWHSPPRARSSTSTSPATSETSSSGPRTLPSQNYTSGSSSVATNVLISTSKTQFPTSRASLTRTRSVQMSELPDTDRFFAAIRGVSAQLNNNVIKGSRRATDKSRRSTKTIRSIGINKKISKPGFSPLEEHGTSSLYYGKGKGKEKEVRSDNLPDLTMPSSSILSRQSSLTENSFMDGCNTGDTVAVEELSTAGSSRPSTSPLAITAITSSSTHRDKSGTHPRLRRTDMPPPPVPLLPRDARSYSEVKDCPSPSLHAPSIRTVSSTSMPSSAAQTTFLNQLITPEFKLHPLLHSHATSTLKPRDMVAARPNPTHPADTTTLISSQKLRSTVSINIPYSNETGLVLNNKQTSLVHDTPAPSSQPRIQAPSSTPNNKPPVLGMRRTHTFPSESNGTTNSNSIKDVRNRQAGVDLPTHQKSFKPPLLPRSQPVMSVQSQAKAHQQRQAMKPPSSPLNTSSMGDRAPGERLTSTASVPPPINNRDVSTPPFLTSTMQTAYAKDEFEDADSSFGEMDTSFDWDAVGATMDSVEEAWLGSLKSTEGDQA